MALSIPVPWELLFLHAKAKKNLSLPKDFTISLQYARAVIEGMLFYLVAPYETVLIVNREYLLTFFDSEIALLDSNTSKERTSK